MPFVRNAGINQEGGSACPTLDSSSPKADVMITDSNMDEIWPTLRDVIFFTTIVGCVIYAILVLMWEL